MGFAESNPLADLNGSDSAAKIKILSSISFNRTISNNKILTEGIQNINLTDILHAKKLGYKIFRMLEAAFEKKPLVLKSEANDRYIFVSSDNYPGLAVLHPNDCPSK